MDWMADLFCTITGIAFGSLIGTVLLRASAKWVQKMHLPFSDAYLTMFLWGLTLAFQTFIVDWAVNAALPSQGDPVLVPIKVLFVVCPSFFILAALVTFRFRIPFRRSCFVSLALYGLALCLYSILPILWLAGAFDA